MQRVRMSLPYFERYGWQAEVVTVDERYADLPKDELLLEGLPENLKIYKVKALPKKITSRFGLGSIALRSLFFFRATVNDLLKRNHYDLIYFSTTQFPVCVLGVYWKRKFGVPFVIDFQDPWHSEYYRDKPKEQQPPKYWLSYRLNKWLEPIAANHADGLISVSQGYLEDMERRYPRVRLIPSSVITFGAFDQDLVIAEKHCALFPHLLDADSINIVYVGRGGADMHRSIKPVFRVLLEGIAADSRFERFKFYFIGTSYAPSGHGTPSVLPLAVAMGLEKHVVEITDRVGFYHALCLLGRSNALFVPGSDDANYTASKIFPYLSTRKPLLAVFKRQSSVIDILKQYGARHVFDADLPDISRIKAFLTQLLHKEIPAEIYHADAIDFYSAQRMTERQCLLFDEIIHGKT